MRRRTQLLDVVEVAAVDDGENSEQALEDGHGGLLEVLRIGGVCPRGGGRQQQAQNKTQKAYLT